MKLLAPILYLSILVLAQSSCRTISVIRFNKSKCQLNIEAVQEKKIERIAFGSCSKQNEPQPILNYITDKKPDLFIYLGDNIYGDTRDMRELKVKYQELGDKKEFQRLRESTTVLATWDDHDYGENDAGKYYPRKEASKEIFLKFWCEPKDSERRKHPGIYHSLLFGTPPDILQVILLDTRTFRDNLLPNDGVGNHRNDYRPNPDPDSTFLGTAQWQWLEEQLRLPASIRIIASSNQFSHEYNGWESWTNVPHEQKRFLDLIKKTGAEGVVFISGDVHWGELSRMEVPGQYPVYDLTSSGLTETWDSIEPNANRIGEPVREANYGFITIDWEGKHPDITLEIYDKDNHKRLNHVISLDEISN